MPDYVDTTTLDLYRSQYPQPANTAELTRAEYNAAAAIEPQYRKWTGSAVEEMTQPEKDAVDAAAAIVTRDAARLIATENVDDTDGGVGHNNRALIEVFNQRDNYLINRILELQAALDAIKASSGPVDNIRNAVPATWLATNTRDKPTSVQAYKDEISSGGADS
jgi:hypothetical protein